MGCLIDGGPFQGAGSEGSGAGATAGGGDGGGGGTTTGPSAGGGGTATATATATSSGTATSTWTGKACSLDEECNELGFCSAGACVSQHCVYSPKPLGTPISNPDPTDCKAFVCDGEGKQTETALDTEIPPQTGAPCEKRRCMRGEPILMQIPDGQPCNMDPSQPCHVNSCMAGVCTEKPGPDGMSAPDNDMSDCALPVCSGGVPMYVGYDSLCNDATPTDCKLPVCEVDGSGGKCMGTKNAPQGTACTKTNGMAGTCNPSGSCS